MATELRVEDRLDGQSNFSAWKERIISVFDEANVWDIVEKIVAIPTNATQLATFKRKNAKAKTPILDGIKDHVIPHMRGKDHAFEMWIALNNLYQSSNENRTMVLKYKLKATKMNKSESVIAYLTRITNVRDELAAIGEIVVDPELMRTSL